MALKIKPHFSDRQIARLLAQLQAAFSGYQVRTGIQADGKERFLTIPMINGGMDRVAAYLVRGGSDNVMSSVPVGSVVITRIQQNPNHRQAPQHFEKFHYVERAKDEDGKILVNVPGKKKTIEWFMPVSHIFDFEVAYWLSNQDQLYQIIEQITAVYNPSNELLISNSQVDPGSITEVIFGGEFRIERAVPDGTNIDPLYVVTMPFTVEFWIGLPAKVYESKPIYEIHVPIYEILGEVDFDTMPEIDKLVIRADEQDILTAESY